MEDIQIGIIGGTRGMGKWFAGFLSSQGFTVHAAGRTAGKPPEEMARCCHVVVISVPIGVTGEVIARVGPLLGKSQLLMDLTSLKAAPVRMMLECSRSEVIGCHPLFGPDVGSMVNRHVVICPARTGKWLVWLRGLLNEGGASLFETTPERHDELMALVQGLNHFHSIILGVVLSYNHLSSPLSRLDQVTTPSFESKVGALQKIFRENPRLYAEILCHNPYMGGVLTLYEQAVQEVSQSVLRGDAEAVNAALGHASGRLWPDDRKQ